MGDPRDLKSLMQCACVGSSPTGATIKETWQTWCMHWTENPANVVRFHETPLNN